MAKPLVSLLIDTYNHESFIKKVIVLEQNFPAVERELVVIDNGSDARINTLGCL
jgi:glycosyltransferase involved in cell wall biosynthesis